MVTADYVIKIYIFLIEYLEIFSGLIIYYLIASVRLHWKIEDLVRL
jgi:hypothetical protein